MSECVLGVWKEEILTAQQVVGSLEAQGIDRPKRRLSIGADRVSSLWTSPEDPWTAAAVPAPGAAVTRERLRRTVARAWAEMVNCMMVFGMFDLVLEGRSDVDEYVQLCFDFLFSWAESRWPMAAFYKRSVPLARPLHHRKVSNVLGSLWE